MTKIREFFSKIKEPVPKSRIYDLNSSVEISLVENCLRDLLSKGEIYEPKSEYLMRYDSK